MSAEQGPKFELPDGSEIPAASQESQPNPEPNTELPVEASNPVSAEEAYRDAEKNYKQLDRKEKLARNIANAKERRANDLAEVIKTGARNPQEMLDLVSELSFKELKECERRAKYGAGTLGKIKSWLAGEYDFDIGEKDEITQKAANHLAEAGRRVASTVFNRRTAISGATLAGLGLLTGGLGWAAGGVLYGGIAGRGVAEMGELIGGKLRGAREEVLEAEREVWGKMQTIAQEIQNTPDDNEGIMKKNKLSMDIADLMHRQGNNYLIQRLAEKERNLETREAKFNKMRNRLQTAGELVGAAAGLTSILNGGVEHLDMDLWNKIDGQSIFHGVQQTVNGSQFLYSSASEAAAANLAHATITAGGHFGAHALGATTTQLLGYTIAERTAPMLIASGLAWASERKVGKFAELSSEDPNNLPLVELSPDEEKEFMGSPGEHHVSDLLHFKGIKPNSGRVRVRSAGNTIVVATDGSRYGKLDEQEAVDQPTDRGRQAENLYKQIPTNSEFLENIADKHNSFIPENPRGYTYDWKTQPKVVDNPEDIASADRWYLYKYDQEKDLENPIIDNSTGKIVDVVVMGVDVENNRIAIARTERDSETGASHMPIETQPLDKFLTKYRLHLDSKTGKPISNSPEIENQEMPVEVGQDIKLDGQDWKVDQILDEDASGERKFVLTGPAGEGGTPITKTVTENELALGTYKNLRLSEDKAETSTKGKPLTTSEPNEIDKQFLRGFNGERDRGKEELNRKSFIERIYNNLPKETAEILEEAGIETKKTVLETNSEDPTKNSEEYLVTLKKNNGEIGTLKIYSHGGELDILSSEFKHVYPDDLDGKKTDHFFDGNIPVGILKAFTNDILNRLDQAEKRLKAKEVKSPEPEKAPTPSKEGISLEDLKPHDRVIVSPAEGDDEQNSVYRDILQKFGKKNITPGEFTVEISSVDKDSIKLVGPSNIVVRVDASKLTPMLVRRADKEKETTVNTEVPVPTKHEAVKGAVEDMSFFTDGSEFKFTNAFRRDDSASDIRKNLADAWFSNLAEGKRVAKLFDTTMAVRSITERGDGAYDLVFTAKRNGGYISERSMKISPEDLKYFSKV